MIDEEAEYRKVFLYQKRVAKHWQRNSAHRAHSSTQYLIEPAKATLNYMNSIDAKDRSYNTKLELLDTYFIEQDRISKSSNSYNDYYYINKQINKKAYESISRGEPVFIPKIYN